MAQDNLEQPDTELRGRRAYGDFLLGAVMTAVLCSMPSVITAVIWFLHNHFGYDAWVTFEKPPEVDSLTILPFIFLLGNWPLLVILVVMIWKYSRV